MPPVWLPGARVDAGVHADYGAGRTRMQFAVCHYTAGTDSSSIGRNGYFHILFHKLGTPTQYAPIDALTWHAGSGPDGTQWNPFGPGAEWERLTGDEPLTPDQIEWGARWIAFCGDWGIPPDHYRGPRYEAHGHRGHVDHRDLCSDRSDGLSDAEWNAMVGGAPPTAPEDDDMTVWLCLEAGPWQGAWVQEGPYTLIQFQSVNDVSPGRACNVSAQKMETIYNNVVGAQRAAGI